MNPRPLAAIAITCTLLLMSLRADGDKDNHPEDVRRIPPAGIAISEADRAELQAGVAELRRQIDELWRDVKGDLRPRICDVEIFHKAVAWALRYDEFYAPNEVNIARDLLKTGMERAVAMRSGKAPWTTATGLTVRGYRSRIDGSIQPYGLLVPAGRYEFESLRLDTWFHGRGEKLTELAFINNCLRSPGEFTPPGAIVLQPYGRYCNANKFAGEIDLFEALDDVKSSYRISEGNCVVRGFSMGGAACWQFATHYADLWAAANPGAGFSETPDFLKVFQNESLQPTWYEKKLWHWYDCTDYAANLFNLPTVAYSGEIDRQKQAADMMEKAMADEGLTLTHIIGPKTAHSYEPESKKKVAQLIDELVSRGRDDVPTKIRFTTWTLRYNRMRWMTVDVLERHWDRARVDGEIMDRKHVKVDTKNVTALTLSMPAGQCPLTSAKPVVTLDEQPLEAPPVAADRSWLAQFHKVGNRWVQGPPVEAGVHKTHGLQGPIDDAFMDAFIMVRPTGKPMNENIGGWIASEQAHAIEHWRRQFRGEARVKDDMQITEQDITSHHLVLWGDPSSNSVLAKIIDKLPITWDAKGVKVGDKVYEAGQHVPVLIYPNPLNPRRYVVINSGFTFREYDYLNNARQVPKLPDWAVLDISTPPDSRFPGKVVGAGFFDERWQLQAHAQE